MTKLHTPRSRKLHRFNHVRRILNMYSRFCVGKRWLRCARFINASCAMYVGPQGPKYMAQLVYSAPLTSPRSIIAWTPVTPSYCSEKPTPLPQGNHLGRAIPPVHLPVWRYLACSIEITICSNGSVYRESLAHWISFHLQFHCEKCVSQDVSGTKNLVTIVNTIPSNPRPSHGIIFRG